MTTDKLYTYNIVIRGYGGEDSCVPLTDEQAAYWKDRGEEALSAHLCLRGEEDEDVPTEHQLPDYRDSEYPGVDPDGEISVTIEDLASDFSIEFKGDNEEFRERFHFALEIGPVGQAPDQPVVMFQTVLKGSNVYQISTKKPFDLSLLTFNCAEVARLGDIIFSVSYNGEDAEYIDGMDQEKQNPIAILLTK